MVATTLRQFSNIAFPKLQVPVSAGLVIDFTHPLSNGLVGAFVPGVTGSIDLCGNLQSFPIIGAASLNVGTEGPGLKTTAAGDVGYRGNAPTAYLNYNTGMSMYYRGLVQGAPNNSAYYFGISHTTTDSSPFAYFAIQDAGGTAWELAFNNTSFQSTGTSAYPAFPFLGSAGATGKPGSQIFYVNGVSAGTNTAAGNASAPSTPQLCMNCYLPATTREVTAVSFCGYIWNRVLSADEMLQIHLDPYGFLQPVRPDMADASGAAGTFKPWYAIGSNRFIGAGLY